MLTYPEGTGRNERKAIAFNVCLLSLAALGLVSIMCSGCTSLPDPQAVSAALVARPVVELTLHAGDADAVRKLAERYQGVVELDAVTIGSVIVHLKSPPSETTRRHECVHVQQWRREGPAYGVKYWAANATNGYANNPYEVEAYARENDPAGPTPDTDCR